MIVLESLATPGRYGPTQEGGKIRGIRRALHEKALGKRRCIQGVKNHKQESSGKLLCRPEGGGSRKCSINTTKLDLHRIKKGNSVVKSGVGSVYRRVYYYITNANLDPFLVLRERRLPKIRVLTKNHTLTSWVSQKDRSVQKKELEGGSERGKVRRLPRSKKGEPRPSSGICAPKKKHLDSGERGQV